MKILKINFLWIFLILNSFLLSGYNFDINNTLPTTVKCTLQGGLCNKSSYYDIKSGIQSIEYSCGLIGLSEISCIDPTDPNKEGHKFYQFMPLYSGTFDLYSNSNGGIDVVQR